MRHCANVYTPFIKYIKKKKHRKGKILQSDIRFVKMKTEMLNCSLMTLNCLQKSNIFNLKISYFYPNVILIRD